MLITLDCSCSLAMLGFISSDAHVFVVAVRGRRQLLKVAGSVL